VVWHGESGIRVLVQCGHVGVLDEEIFQLLCALIDAQLKPALRH
jgi:hypothetical protein